MLPFDNPNPNTLHPNQNQPSSSMDSLPPLVTTANPIPNLNSPLDNSFMDPDSDIDALIGSFFDQPSPQLLPSLPHSGSTSNSNAAIKRGFDTAVDHFDNAASIKRGRINNVAADQQHATFEIQNPTFSPPQDHRGGEIHADHFINNNNYDNNYNNNRAVGGGEQQQRKRPVFEIDFISNALREAEAAAQAELAFREAQAQAEPEPELELGLPQNSDDYANFDDLMEPDNVEVQYVPMSFNRRIRNMERFRVIAKENAIHYARFDSEGGVEGPSSSLTPQGIDDSATPFAIAMKAIKDRAMKKKVVCETWVPKAKKSNQQGEKRFSVPVPSLQELCLEILADNADAMVSVEGVPDELRRKLSKLLCDSRKMNIRFLELLLSGSPTEIRLKDCSWLTEEQFAKSFQMCDTTRLEVLQLDQCGRCIPDYALLVTLRQSPRWLPKLVTLSLSGACRLSDKGLHVLVSSAPVLRSINLSQCSLLSSASINILADSLGILLKELYLDDCLMIDAAQIVPGLKKLEHLEVLSLAGIQTVSDEFIKDYIIACGHNMKELILKDCRGLTDASIKVIAEHCPGLCALDLMHLEKLTDLTLGYLTNSCRALHTLKLCRNPFSDEAIAAFLDISGDSLKELSLNNIKKVGLHTTLSLSRHAKNLHTLDLSWCRNLTDNELGFIVDSCFSLRLLKLFGCSLVTDVFLNGHSNPEIQILGLKMSPLLQTVKVPDPYPGPLRYSPVSVDLI